MWTLGHGATSASLIDPVTTWKKVALQSARLAAREQQAAERPFVRVSSSLGFAFLVLLSQVFALRSGDDAAVATLLVLPSTLLMHELPRALLARALGRSSKVVIAATGSHTQLVGAPLEGSARLAFNTVGSIANVASAIALSLMCQRVSGKGWALLAMLAGCQAAWGLGQAMPVIPFRAGLAIAGQLRPKPRLAHAGLSLLFVSALSAVVSNTTWGFAVVPVLVLATLATCQNLACAYRESRDEQTGVVAIAQQAAAHVRGDDPAGAIAAAERGLALARSVKLVRDLNKTLAWAVIAKSETELAHLALERLPASDIELHLIAAYLSCCDRLDDAAQLLQQARARGHRSAETTKLGIDVLYRSGKHAAARALAEAEKHFLSAEDWLAIDAAIGS